MHDSGLSAGNAEPLLRLLGCGRPHGPLRRLLQTHGDAWAALAAGHADWASHGLRPGQVAALRQPDAAALDRALRWLSQPGHHLLGWTDADYPPLLRRISSPPLVLFVAGDPALLWRPSVAVVGSRRATPAGCANATAFARAIAMRGLCVASGLAAGIDAAAHQAALGTEGGTLAVQGTGPDRVYPLENAALHAAIVAQGAVISEHPPGTAPLREHFPSRNRILAGLSVGTLVVEAAERSGALITARLAAEAGREVMAIPGSIHNPLSRGCHRLIRDGATLVESTEEVLELLAPVVTELAKGLRGTLLEPHSEAQSGAQEPALPIDPAHSILWSALGHDPTDMDQLVERTGLTAAGLSSMLLALELDGRVAVEHGRYFRIGR